MNQASSPSGAASFDVSAISSELSQWLYLHTSLGKGYVAPIHYTPVWVMSSGVPAELAHRMRTAENLFHEVHEQSVASDRAKLEGLEQAAQAAKGRRGVGLPGPDSHASLEAQVKELKVKLARPVFVNYRDWTADKSTILELLSKSKFRAMSFVDEMGIRAHNYTTNKFLAAKHIASDLSLLSLVGDQSSDSVLIRSSATGGANILSVRGADSPRFNLMTLTSPQAIRKIAGRLKEAEPCRGITLTLPHTAQATLAVPADQIARVIAKVYATETPDHRITVNVTPAWTEFLNANAPSGSQAAQTATDNALCNRQTLVHSVARAIITRRIYLQEGDLQGPDPDRLIQLNDTEDLPLAQAWVAALLDGVTGTKHLAVRADNAAKARAARAEGPTPEHLDAARRKLIKWIQADPDGYIPWTPLTRDLGAGMLNRLLETYPGTFCTIVDVQRPGTRNAIKQAVALMEGWNQGCEKVADLNTPAGCEKVDDLNTPHEPGPVGGTPTITPGSQLNDATLDALYREWQEEAYKRMRMGGPPTITIADLPPPLRASLPAVQQRHWRTTTILPSGKPHGDAGHPSLELWFRLSPRGGPMCAWELSFLEWKLAEKWEDKDARTDTDED